MEFKIEAVAKQLKTTKSSNKTYTGVKLEGVGWVNVMGDMRGFSAQGTIHLTQPKPIGDGNQLWAFPTGRGENEAESVPRKTAFPQLNPEPAHQQLKPEPEMPHGAKLPTPTASEIGGIHKEDKSYRAWASFVRFAWGVAKDLEPNDPQARVALVNTAVIAWTHGGILWSTECDGGCCGSIQKMGDDFVGYEEPPFHDEVPF